MTRRLMRKGLLPAKRLIEGERMQGRGRGGIQKVLKTQFAPNGMIYVMKYAGTP